MTDLNESIARAFGEPDRVEEIKSLVDLVGGEDELQEALVKRTNQAMENQVVFAGFLTTAVRQLKQLDDRLEDMDDITVETAIEAAEFGGFVKGMAFSFALDVMGAETINRAIDFFGHDEAIDQIASKGFELAEKLMMAHQMFADITGTEGVDGARDLIRLLSEHNGDLSAVAAEKMAQQAGKFLDDNPIEEAPTE
jgi:hypothetical protein